MASDWWDAARVELDQQPHVLENIANGRITSPAPRVIEINGGSCGLRNILAHKICATLSHPLSNAELSEPEKYTKLEF